jgi:hypothetical protein
MLVSYSTEEGVGERDYDEEEESQGIEEEKEEEEMEEGSCS